MPSAVDEPLAYQVSDLLKGPANIGEILTGRLAKDDPVPMLLGGLVALGDIAVIAARPEIVGLIGSSSAPGHDVIKYVCGISAVPAVFGWIWSSGVHW